MASSSLLLRTLKGEPIERIPFWFMRQAGRYLPEYQKVRKQAGSFLQLCYNPEWAAEVTLQPIHRFGMDAAIIFSDILVIPQAMGMELTFMEGEGPKLNALSGKASIDALSTTAVTDKLQPVYEALRLTKKELSVDKALIGFSGAPWTLACYMLEGGSSADFIRARTFALREEEAFSSLISKLEEAIILHLGNQIEAGADVVQIFDSWAGLLSPMLFERYAIPCYQRIAFALQKKHPHTPVIVFPRLAASMMKLPLPHIHAIGIDTSVSFTQAQKRFPHTLLQGNLDPLLLAYDNSKALAYTEMLLRESEAEKRPFIFNLGHGIIPATPIAHVEALCERLRNATWNV